MIKNSLKLIGIVALLSTPRIISNPQTKIENLQNPIAQEIKEIKINESKKYLQTVNKEIIMAQKALDFLEERKNYAQQNKDAYQKISKEYSNKIKNLKNERDSIYKIIYSE